MHRERKIREAPDLGEVARAVARLEARRTHGDRRDSAILSTLLVLALRRAELRAIELGDLEPSKEPEAPAIVRVSRKGGRVDRLALPRPAWRRLRSWLEIRALDRVGWVLALRDLGAQAGPLTTDGLPFGANFAIRRDVQSRFPYDPALGRLGDSLRSGEEALVLKAILGEGMSGRWVPDALVRHWIPKERQTLQFFRDRAIAAGRGVAAEEDVSGARLFGRPRWIWRAWVEAQAAYRYHRLFSPAEKWVPAFVRTAIIQGHFRGPFQPSDPSP